MPRAAVAREGLPSPFRPWAVPPWILFVAWLWWRAAADRLAALPAAAAPPEPGLAALAVAALKLAGHAAEALWYVACARALGVRVPFGRLALAIVTLSTLDVLRLALLEPPAGAGFDPRLPLVGAELLAGRRAAAAGGAAAAFGSLGLLTLLRVGGTAWALARAAGGRRAAAACAVVATWLLTRLATWWGVDLARGPGAAGGG